MAAGQAHVHETASRPLAQTLPAGAYRDPAQYEDERRSIFARAWLVLARADQVATPGSYVAGEVAGYPVVVLRDDDGRLRGFHNVCRHRAGPLVADGTGTCRGGLVCGYHGWSYRTDGSLRRARDFEVTADDRELDGDDLGLFPVQAEVWANLVWVNLDPQAAALRDDLGPFVAEIEAFPVAGYECRVERTEELACNWKTYVDNYLEGYHIPFVHPTLMREVDITQYRVDTHDRYCTHEAPPRDGAANLGRWTWRWPNLALNIYADGMNVERIMPMGHDRTRIVYTYFFFGTVDDAVVDHTMQVSDRTLAEDRVICEAVQRNLDAGVYESGTLSPKHENGVAYFHGLVRDALEVGGQAH